MSNRIFGILCALVGALAVISYVQRVEISALKMVLWQMHDGEEGDAVEEMFQG